MTNIIDVGVGRAARESWAGERPVPQTEFQVFGFYVGLIMDDADPQGMGRLWVYIPAFSGAVDGKDTTRLKRQAPPKTQRNDRSGWILCYPIFPFFGADNYREDADQDTSTDGPSAVGRNPRKNESNSYGMFYQPRIGDYVACLFAQGDPSKAYWMGCIPKQYQNFMVPGHAAANTTERDTSGNMVPGPAHERDEFNQQTRKPSRTFFSTLTEAGLISDPLRGAGTGSSRRESPSRIGWGVKTPGDPDTQMMGHQIVMDDLPAAQGVRIRTSRGAQVYLNDSNDFIYINTPRGNIWMELDGSSGRLNVFTENSVSIHTGADFNLRVDGNMNVDVAGNLNLVVGGTSAIELQQDTSLKVGQTSGDFKIETQNNLHVLSQQDINLEATTNLNALSQAEIRLQASSDFSVTSGGSYRESAGTIWMNSGAGSPADPATATTAAPRFTLPGPPVGTPPTAAGQQTAYAAAIVPQHEPWPEHHITSPGLVGVVEEDSAFTSTLRAGSSVPNATAPDTIVGVPRAGMTPGIYTGRPYQTASFAETPQYDFQAPITGLNPASTYSLSDAGLAQIKGFEGFRSCAYPDAGKTSIGYGHQIQPGESIPTCISTDQAEAILLQDLQKFQRCVQDNVDVDITQQQFDSMVSLAYNIGCNRFANSSMIDSFNAGDTSDAINEWMGFVKSQGQVVPVLVTRRQKEVQYAFSPPVSA